MDFNTLNRQLRDAQRRAQAQHRRQVSAYNREVDRVNRANQRAVDDYNRRVDAANRKAVADYNRDVDRVNRENQRRVDAHNRKVDSANKRAIDADNRDVDKVNAHNTSVFASLNRQLRTAASGPRYTPAEQDLADRVQQALVARDQREWDIFLSYARIDGAATADALRGHLEALGVRVWFDEIAITPGISQSRQMDLGLQRARAGIILLTPAYLVGRFWTERELGELLHKDMLIPVLHGVTFAEVREYSGILPDLAGFETARDSVELIAQKIAAAVLPAQAA